MSEDHTLLSANVGRFALRELEPAFAPLRCCGSGIAPRAVADALFEVGVLAPMSAPELAACLEAVAEVEAAPAAMILAHASAARVLEQLAQGPRIGERELLGSPLYEEPAGRPAMLRCRARPRGLELDGHAELIVGAPLADWLLVRARTDEGVALVLARASGEGVHVGEPVETLGMRGCPVADVRFDRAPVPRDALVAACADSALARGTAWARGPALAICTGILARSLSAASDYARARVQGGVPIALHHEVRRMLAGMMADLAFCRDATARLCDHERASEPEASLIFAEAKRRAALATCDGVQILGGNGYMEDYPAERCMRDARQAQAIFGRADACVQRAMGAWAAEGGAS